MSEDVTSAFYDIEMRYTTAAFLKQSLSPYSRQDSFYESPYYQTCSISPQQLPSKPLIRTRNSKIWAEAKIFLTHLSKLEVQYYHVGRKEITRFIYQCLRRVNVNKQNAKVLVDALIDADSKKEFGKGLYRLLMYVADIMDKSCEASASPIILKSNDTTAWVDGMNALGPVIGKHCMDLAIDKAKNHGVGVIVARQSNYLGKCTWFTKMAMENDLIGMTFSNSPHALCPTRAKKSFLGWNPIALSAPASRKSNNIFMEVKSTALTLRQILTFIGKGYEMPVNCAVDAEGQMTTDPVEALYEGCVLPLGGVEDSGGYKGYALAIVVEIMSGILGNSFFGRDLKRVPERGQTPVNLGHCFIAVNPKFFCGNFKKRMDGLVRSIRKLEPLKENEPVLIPGDYENFLQSHISIGNKLQYRLVDLMAAYQLSCMLNISPLKLK